MGKKNVAWILAAIMLITQILSGAGIVHASTLGDLIYQIMASGEASNSASKDAVEKWLDSLPDASRDALLQKVSGNADIASGDIKLPSWDDILPSGEGIPSKGDSGASSGNQGTDSGGSQTDKWNDILDKVTGNIGSDNSGSNIVSDDKGLFPTTKVTNLKMSATTIDSVTLSWTKVTEANWYVISYWPSGSASSSVVLENVGDVDNFKIAGLSQCEYVFYVIPAKRLEDGSLKYNTLIHTSIKCAPTAKRPTGISVTNVMTGNCSLVINGLGNSETSFYQSEAYLYNANGKKLGSYTGGPTGLSISDTRIKKNNFYSVKVRGYYRLPDGTRINGEWGKLKYFGTSLKSVKGKVTGKKNISLNWSKVKGAGYYIVYARKTSGSNFIKVAKVKKTKVTLKKIGKKTFKKGCTYNIKVVANMKKGAAVYKCKSDTYKIRIPNY